MLDSWLSSRYSSVRFVSPLKSPDSMLDIWLLPRYSSVRFVSPLKSPDSMLDSWLLSRSQRCQIRQSAEVARFDAR